MISFTGRLENERALLRWATASETDPVAFEIEKSTNGTTFNSITSLNGYNNPGAARNNYSFTDPERITGKVFYRIKMKSDDGMVNYTRTLVLENEVKDFSFATVINPFTNSLHFDIASIRDTRAKAQLIDQFGKTIKQTQFDLRSGVNQLSFDGTGSLAGGMYILRVESGDMSIYRKVIKQ
jgi:hypothetical protein